jgi:UDP-N-acetyl-D-glucosamine dehydrogenase
MLSHRGAQVAYYDPFVPVIRLTREHPHWAGTQSIAWNKATISEYDVVLISTAHDAVNYKELGAWAKCVVDTRNAMKQVQNPTAKVYKA